MNDTPYQSGMKQNSSPYSALQSAFDAQELKARDRFYSFEEEESLLPKLKAALQQSDTGARLLKVAEDNNVKIHLIKTRYLQSAATENREVFLGAKEGQKDPQMPQTLEFGGVLREAEQILMGLTTPRPDTDPLERASAIHTKFLDKISHMCKIGIELENLYGSHIYEAIQVFGYEEIYNAQKKALSPEEVKDIYLEAQPETNIEEDR